MSHIIDILFAPEIFVRYYTKSLEDSQDLSPPRGKPMQKTARRQAVRKASCRIHGPVRVGTRRLPQSHPQLIELIRLYGDAVEMGGAF
jgi:hypothetical protein